MRKLFLLFCISLSYGSIIHAADSRTGALSKEARDARKAQTFGRFDLDGNGRLDRAERSLLRAELKSKMDPVKKRIIATTTTNMPPVRPQ